MGEDIVEEAVATSNKQSSTLNLDVCAVLLAFVPALLVKVGILQHVS